MQTTLQNSKQAEKYFEDEVNFTINPRGVEVALQKGESVTIVDLRDEASYATGHIPGAINIPYDKFQRFSGPEKEFSGLKRNSFNYIYCYDLLCGLTKVACLKFASLGYPVKEMKGGFKEWSQSGYSIEK